MPNNYTKIRTLESCSSKASNDGSYASLLRRLFSNSPIPSAANDSFELENSLMTEEKCCFLPVLVDFPTRDLEEFSSSFRVFDEEGEKTKQFKTLTDTPYDETSCITFYFSIAKLPPVANEKTRFIIIYNEDASVQLQVLNDAGLKAIRDLPRYEEKLAAKLANNLMAEVNLILMEHITQTIATPDLTSQSKGFSFKI